VIDVPEAEVSAGPTLLGSRLLAGNAVMYARSITYAFAALEQRKGGATIGLRSEPADAVAAVSAAAAELDGDLQAQRLVTWPGLRLDDEVLAPLTRHDRRSPLGRSRRDGVPFDDELVALGAAAGAEHLLAGLAGRAAAIEGFGPVGVALAREIESRGGRVAKISTASGAASGPLSAADLAEAWTTHGPDLVSQMGEPAKAWEIFRGGDVDVLFVGSAPGALSGQGAESLGQTPVVPTGPAPVSSKALAVLRRAGTPVLPDFVTTCGPILAWWPEGEVEADTVRAQVQETVTALLDETGDHPDGPFMGACHRAEAFLATWVPELPFGRPLG
jgi:hypothetical protein